VNSLPGCSLVPSLSFHPTPTVCSSSGFTGLLHPAANHGVRRVSMSSCPTRMSSATVEDLSPTALCPSKLFPRKQPVRVTAPDALSPLLTMDRPRSSCEGTGHHIGHSTSGPCSTCEAVARRSTVASRVLHVASLGFSFRRVFSPTRRSSELRAHGHRTSRRQWDFSFTLSEPRASSHRRRWC